MVLPFLVLLIGVSAHALTVEPKEDKFLSEFQVVVSRAMYKCDTGDGQLHAVENITDCVFEDTTLLNNESVSPEAVYFFHELLRKARNQEIRQKRQASAGYRREEMRVLSEREWHRFVSRLQMLKKAGRYDEIVRFHSSRALQAAHNGESFLGWHRIFLLWLESYLGILIPYWDSTLDFHMRDPKESIIWSDYYVGNGRGLVVTGPFAYWTAVNNRVLLRNISGGGSLLSRENVRSLLKRKTNVDLIHHEHDIESVHNALHVWVGGHMLNIEASPSDPLFFMHHCFIDKIWADAQRNMINPEYYPYNGKNPFHHPSHRMVSFPIDIPNKVGYQRWINNLASYAPSPSEGNCYSRRRDVRVLEVDRNGRCISARAPVTRGSMYAARYNAEAAARGATNYRYATAGLNPAIFISDLEDRRIYSNLDPAYNRYSHTSYHYNKLQAFVPKRMSRFHLRNRILG